MASIGEKKERRAAPPRSQNSASPGEDELLNTLTSSLPLSRLQPRISWLQWEGRNACQVQVGCRLFVSSVSVTLRVEHRYAEVPRLITRGVEIHSNENRAERSSGAASGLAHL